jgi:hypothetical protein
MKFLLFSKIPLEVSDPFALIESYCFQSDFYAHYDLTNDRTVEHTNKIGARINKELLRKCKTVTENTKDLRIFEHDDIDCFLELDEEIRNSYIKELDEKVIKKLKVKGIGLSKATKVLHTLYPEIIPIIDNALQKEYKQIKPEWSKGQSVQILVDYYNNFKKGDNWQNLTEIFNKMQSNKLLGLTKVRIFDILWWSYLKSKKLRQEKGVNWSTIK